MNFLKSKRFLKSSFFHFSSKSAVKVFQNRAALLRDRISAFEEILNDDSFDYQKNPEFVNNLNENLFLEIFQQNLSKN